MHTYSSLFDRYLALLHLSSRRPSLDALSELTSAHLAHVPFENVSKLYYRSDNSRKGISDLARYLDGVEQFRFGGTCYANNLHFNELLTHLGYEVVLCGADMAAPNVHIVNTVTLQGRKYLVDVGYGAPFVDPVPFDAETDHEIVWGTFRYVFKPASVDGWRRLEMYREGVLKHGYVVNPAPRSIGDFADVITESFTDRATFMHALLVARFGDEQSVMIRNLTLSKLESGKWNSSEIGRAQIPEVVHREFGMSLEIVRQALDGIRFTKEA